MRHVDTDTDGFCLSMHLLPSLQVPVVVTEQERMHTHHHHTGMRQEVEVCGQKTFTDVEDRPVVRERVERVVEHRPVEKQVGASTALVNVKGYACICALTTGHRARALH